MPTKTQVEQETVERLRAALGMTARYLRATDAGEGLTPTELSILATISRRGSLRLTELAEIERVNPTMLSRIAGPARRGPPDQPRGRRRRPAGRAGRGHGRRPRPARAHPRPAHAPASPPTSTNCPTTTYRRCAQRSRPSRRWPRACAATRRARPQASAREPRSNRAPHVRSAREPELPALVRGPGHLARRHVDADDRPGLAGLHADRLGHAARPRRRAADGARADPRAVRRCRSPIASTSGA